ncbi:alpha-mannosidase 2 [Bacillus rossius redtenbacheri]|uniref:alpha-mannosidase 2 n=1 Tax=Bacillus rossius redtenbacheri TaxID=93214 RepID=UPI002FDE3EDA
MRIRKLSAIVGACLIFGGCIMLYMIMDHTFLPQEYQQDKWMQLEGRLKLLEQDLHRHHELVGALKHSVRELANSSSQPPAPSGQAPARQTPDARRRLLGCSLRTSAAPATDVQLLELYKQLKFDNLDGGVWKQGWNIEYSPHSWSPRKKLKVFVVPHSHNDPGWLKTYEDYYRSQTRNILNNLVKKLKEDERRKFIWAETSFLALWWDEIPQETKEEAKKLIANGQLEVVNGGWVMNDEANTHYYSILTQMIEGHQWLEHNLGFKPRNSWTIDPFGLSSSMPFLLKKMGMDNVVIQRVHYSVKKALAKKKQLEFRWRQLWDGTGATDFFTHMMPFYSYDVPHTCGPDPKVCCQFDFRRLPGYGMTCPWRVPPQTITDHNVAHRAELLLDQYRKKAQLYRTNVVLAPLGDDFRYDQQSEWDAQYKSYQRLFDYLNNNPNLNVQAQFGTLSDFFDAVRDEMSPLQFPSLSGDFFTYADRDDHYWSGYYTSRPFHKRMDRVLVNYLRSAEVIFSLAWSSSRHSKGLQAPESGLTKLLSDARRSLSLFQHHDGVTGTARDNVVEDYARKMMEAIRGCQHIIQQSAYALLTQSKGTLDPEFTYFDVDDVRKHHNSLPEKTVLAFNDDVTERRVVVYNSLTWKRKELVTVRVSTPYVKITDAEGNTVPSQTSPVFLRSGQPADSHYDVSFVGEVPALGLASYTVHSLMSNEPSSGSVFARLTLLNYDRDVPVIEGFQRIDVHPDGKEFSVSSELLSATFSAQGMLKAVTLRDSGVTVPLHLDFARYSARQGPERSGAYLFLPDGQAVAVSPDVPPVWVVEGPLVSQVRVRLREASHVVALHNTPGVDSLGLEIQNIVDISDFNNYELVMRLSSNIKNGEEFFTDLNGMQMIRRKHFNKLPLQANYYPLPSAAFIEDDDIRLTVLSAQPLGVAALKQGQIEVMQDRRLNQDDNRGLGQGVMDNRPTPLTFRLLLEKRTTKCQSTSPDHPAGFLTLASHAALQSLLHPELRLLWRAAPGESLGPGHAPVSQEPGVDIQLVKVHSFPQDSGRAVGLLLHRQHLDACFPGPAGGPRPGDGLLNVGTLFPRQFGNNMRESSLSFMHDGKQVSKHASQPICPMEMLAFVFAR